MKKHFIRPFSCPAPEATVARERSGPSRRSLFLPLAALLLGAAGAGAQPAPLPVQAAVSTTLRQDDLRVALVAYRLALAGAPLCTERYPLTGLLFHHLAEYEPGDRPLMVARYGLDRGPGVLTVLAQTPAARAGLVAGDVLLAVNGRPLPTGASVAAEPKREKWRRLADEAPSTFECFARDGRCSSASAPCPPVSGASAWPARPRSTPSPPAGPW
jgi:hypothetical protein